MAANAQHENMVAIAATAVTIVRVLVPMAGRFAWHWWNQGTGEVKEDAEAENVVIPEALLQVLQQQQQPQQQQQQQSPATPSPPERKTRISPLYSKELSIKGNLLQDFDAAKKEDVNITTTTTKTTCQFGPSARVVTKDDYSNAIQMIHDTNEAKALSIQVAKSGSSGQQTWSLDSDNDLPNTKIINARFKQMDEKFEEKLARLMRDKVT